MYGIAVMHPFLHESHDGNGIESKMQQGAIPGMLQQISIIKLEAPGTAVTVTVFVILPPTGMVPDDGRLVPVASVLCD